MKIRTIDADEYYVKNVITGDWVRKKRSDAPVMSKHAVVMEPAGIPPVLPFMGMGSGIGSGVTPQHRYHQPLDRKTRTVSRSRFDSTGRSKNRINGDESGDLAAFGSVQSMMTQFTQSTELTTAASLPVLRCPRPPQSPALEHNRNRSYRLRVIENQEVEDSMKGLAQFEQKMDTNKERLQRAKAKQKARKHWEELKNKMSIREMQLFYLKQSSLLRLLESIPLQEIKQAWRKTETEHSKQMNMKRVRDLSRGNPMVQKTLLDELEQEAPNLEFDLTQFRTFIQTVVPTYTFASDEIEYIWQVFDSDKSATLSFVEFFSSLGVVLHHRDKDVNLQYVFRKLDTEEYGKVPKARLCNPSAVVLLLGTDFGGKLHSKLSKNAHEIAEAAQKYCEQNDFEDAEFLSLDEFRVFVYSHPHLLDDFDHLFT